MKRLTKKEKIALTDILTEELKTNRVNLLVTFSRLSVAEMERLRRQIREKKARMKVLKNTLLEKALQKLEQEALCACLGKPVFLVWTKEPDETGLVKVLLEFSRTTQKIELKGGLLDGQILTAEQMVTLGTLPSRKELQAQVVAGLQAPFRRVVNATRYPIFRLVGLLNAIKGKNTNQ